MNFLRRKVIIFGRSIPLAAILTAVVVFSAAAWVSIWLLSARFAVSTSAAMQQPVAQGVWTCEIQSGTGAAIGLCQARLGGDGPEVTVTGLSEDNLKLRLERNFQNPNTVPYNLTITGTQDPKLPVCLTVNGTDCVASVQAAAGATLQVKINVLSAGIGPGESLDITGLQLRWAP